MVVDAERMTLAIVAAVIVVRNAVAVVTAALLPTAVLRLRVLSAMLLPGSPLLLLIGMLLLLRGP